MHNFEKFIISFLHFFSLILFLSFFFRKTYFVHQFRYSDVAVMDANVLDDDNVIVLAEAIEFPMSADVVDVVAL